jgi:ribosomal-protein-alanine N-acetyltransferase
MKNKLLDFLPLETDRLIIIPTSINDIDLILKMDKQEVTQKFLGGIKHKTKEERIEFLKKKTNSLTICLKDNTKIGFIDFKINNDNSAVLSYIFDYDYCNQGYCTESCQLLIDIAFKKLNINKIYADTIKDNESSKRVLDKLNFKYIGTRNEDNNILLEYELKKD